jgi:hypothetical protein
MIITCSDLFVWNISLENSFFNSRKVKSIVTGDCISSKLRFSYNDPVNKKKIPLYFSRFWLLQIKHDCDYVSAEETFVE